MIKRKKVIVTIILIVCVIAVFVIKGYVTNKNKGLETSTNLLTAQVFKGDIEISTSGSAMIESSLKKEIKSIDSGKVDKILVEEGQNVKEGDLLVTFENDSTNSEIERLVLELQQENNSLMDIKDSTKELKIFAPISGYVGDITAELGDELSSGYLFTTVTNKEKVHIPGYFNHAQYKNISIGDKAIVTLSAQLTTVEGRVYEINQTPQPSEDGSILYEVVVEIENPGALLEGMSGEIVISTQNGNFRSVEGSTIEPYIYKDINLEAGGELISLNISSGDYVEKGQLIAELKSLELQRQIENQEVIVDKKNSELSEKIKALDNTAIYSPISGIVTNVNITVGEQVGSETLLLTVSDLDNLEVTIPIDELDINKVEIGQEAKITVDAVPDKIYEATVSKIGLEGVTQNGVSTFDVTLKITESEGLKSGMTAEGKIMINSKKNVLLLPIEAVQYSQNEAFVLKQTEQNDNQMIPIKIGLVSESFVEVIEGVKEGEQVAYRGPMLNDDENMMRMGPNVVRIGGGQPAPAGRTSGGGDR